MADLVAAAAVLELSTFGLGTIFITTATTIGGMALNAEGQAVKKEFVESLYNAADNICAKGENNSLAKFRKGMKEFCDTLTPNYKSIFKYFINIVFMSKFENGQLSAEDFTNNLAFINKMTDSKNVYSLIDELNKYDEKMSDKDFKVFIDTTFKKVLGYTNKVVKTGFYLSFSLMSGIYAVISGKNAEIRKLNGRILTSILFFDDEGNRYARILRENDEAALSRTKKNLIMSERIGGMLDKALRIFSVAMVIISVVKIIETDNEAEQASVKIKEIKDTIIGFFVDVDEVSKAFATPS